MARYAITLALASILSLAAGCGPTYEGAGQMAPPAELQGAPAEAPDTNAATEAGLVEQVAASRNTYKQGLEELVNFYMRNGNNMKLNWAQAELKALNTSPQYRYVIQAEAAGPNLKAMSLMSSADALYNEAMKYYHEGKPLVGIPNDGKLRMALDRFNQLIAQFPSSDKIDDAAYYAGESYEHFKDYTIAAMYYTRAFQWDKNTPYPAQYKAAYIYDKYLTNREKALDLYTAYLATDPHIQSYKEYAEQRVAQIRKEEPPAPKPLIQSAP